MTELPESETKLILKKCFSAVFYGVSSWFNSSAENTEYNMSGSPL